MKVVTYQIRDARANITPAQEEVMRRASVWPRNRHGEELVDVLRGAHDARPTWSDEQIAAFAAGDRRALDVDRDGAPLRWA